MSEPWIRRTESHCEGASGQRLFRRGWLPAQSERLLLVVHGYAEHSGRYEGLGSWFAGRGCVVQAYDHRGHGRSGGVRCHVRQFAELLDDLQRVLDATRAEHPGLPVTIVGHSMGGLVTAAFLAERRPAVFAAVTSGAALDLGRVSPARVWAAKLLRRFLPRLDVGSGLDPQGLSRDPEVVRAYLEDPLVFRHMTTSLAVELLEASRETSGRAGQIEVPLLMLHGAADTLCLPAGSRSFSEGLRAPESVLKVYPKLRHEIFNEPEREQVYADLLAWLEGLEH